MKIQEAYRGCFTVTKQGIREKVALDTIEQLLHVKLIRQYFVCGKYRIDGYDPVNNIAYEVDEEQHFTSRHQAADRKREEEIRDELGCEFIRIKV
jgi:very-short-patch-repair endonuclease